MHKMLGLAFWDSRVGNYRQRRERRQPRRVALPFIAAATIDYSFHRQTNTHTYTHQLLSLSL